MRILNQKDLEITQPDLTVGRLIPDKHFVCHHEAVQEVAEQFHLEVKETYANGGHDMKKVIDVAYVPPQDACAMCRLPQPSRPNGISPTNWRCFWKRSP